MIVAIDPGLNISGISMWSGSGRLLKATAHENPPYPGAGLAAAAERWTSMAEGLWSLAEPYVADDLGSIGRETNILLIELPKVYEQRSRSKGPAADLIQVAAVVGAISVFFGDFQTHVFEPWQWKGQMKKVVTRNRCQAWLSPNELRAVVLPRTKKKDFDVWDAVGLGLWWVREEKLRAHA